MRFETAAGRLLAVFAHAQSVRYRTLPGGGDELLAGGVRGWKRLFD